MISSYRAMGRALVLARRGMGGTRPNPPVGAVLVKDGRIVGEGYHEAAGKPHAEVAALAAAGDRARGADLYVTLEPCNHQGRTPPCVPALLEAGVRRVHFAAHDPHEVSGGGAQALRAAGLEAVPGPREREGFHLLAGFASLVERRRPRFSLKVATTLDGRLATARGDAKWISSEVAQAWGHRRRREADGIVIGAGTAVHDNPALTTRAVAGRSPDRLVLDSVLRTPVGARVWNDDGARRVAVTTAAAPEAARAALEERGVEVWTLPTAAESEPAAPGESTRAAANAAKVAVPEAGRRVGLRPFAERLGREGYTNVFVEGGGGLAGALFAAHLVDVAWVIVAPRLLVGGGGPGWTEGLRVAALARAPRVARTDFRRLGPDWLVTVVPEAAQWWSPEVVHA